MEVIDDLHISQQDKLKNNLSIIRNNIIRWEKEHEEPNNYEIEIIKQNELNNKARKRREYLNNFVQA